MAGEERLICNSNLLVDSGDGVRFEVAGSRGRESAFAVRYQGEVHAYVNRCTHLPYELDWNPGKFFDSEGLVLICSVHGASYDPSSGKCVGGPCHRGLEKLAIEESEGKVYLSGTLFIEDRNHGG